MSNRDRAAEVLGKVRYERSRLATPDMIEWFARDAYREVHALADAGLLAPDLPEPDTQDERFTTFLLNGDVAVKINSKGAVIIEHVDVGWFVLPPGESATLAGILLAAADHAEKEQK